MDINEKLKIIKDSDGLFNYHLESFKSVRYMDIWDIMTPDELASDEYENFLYEHLYPTMASGENCYMDACPYRMKESGFFLSLNEKCQRAIIYNIYVEMQFSYGNYTNNDPEDFYVPAHPNRGHFTRSIVRFGTKKYEKVIEKFINNLILLHSNGVINRLTDYLIAIINSYTCRYGDAQEYEFMKWLFDHNMEELLNSRLEVFDEFMSSICLDSPYALAIQDIVESNDILKGKFRKYTIISTNSTLRPEDKRQVMLDCFSTKNLNRDIDAIISQRDISYLTEYLDQMSIIYKDNPTRLNRRIRSAIQRYFYSKNNTLYNKLSFNGMYEFFAPDSKYGNIAREIIQRKIEEDDGRRNSSNNELNKYNYVIANRTLDDPARLIAAHGLYKQFESTNLGSQRAALHRDCDHIILRDYQKPEGEAKTEILNLIIATWDECLSKDENNQDLLDSLHFLYDLYMIRRKSYFYSDVSDGNPGVQQTGITTEWCYVDIVLYLIKTNPHYIPLLTKLAAQDKYSYILPLSVFRHIGRGNLLPKTGIVDAISSINRPTTLPDFLRHAIHERLDYTARIALLTNYIKDIPGIQNYIEKCYDHCYFDCRAMSTINTHGLFNISQTNPYFGMAITCMLLTMPKDTDDILGYIRSENAKLNHDLVPVGYDLAKSPLISIYYWLKSHTEDEDFNKNMAEYLNKLESYDSNYRKITADFMKDAIKDWFFTDRYVKECLDKSTDISKVMKETQLGLGDVITGFVKELHLDYIIDRLSTITDIDKTKYNEEKALEIISEYEDLIIMGSVTSL